MKHSITLIVGSFVSMSLSGCLATTNSAVTAESLTSDGYDLIARFQTESATSAATMPSTGSATFEGVAAYSSTGGTVQDVIDNASSVSEVTMNANFGTSRISGTANNFRPTQLTNVDQLSGQLNLEGVITGTEFSGTVQGRITEDGTPVDYGGSIDGSFLGDGALGLVGAGSATAAVNGVYVGTAYGVWLAEQ